MADGERAAWDEARWASIVDIARRSPAERLRWLESAIRFALSVGARSREDIIPPAGQGSAGARAETD